MMSGKVLLRTFAGAAIGALALGALLLSSCSQPSTSTTSQPAETVQQMQYYLYVGNSGSQTLSAFSINPKSGGLTPVTGSPYNVPSAVTSMVVDQNDGYLYAASSTAGTISGYSIASASGALSPLSGSPFSVVPDPLAMTLYDSYPGAAPVLYVTSGADTVSAIPVTSGTGYLWPPMVTLSTGLDPIAAAIAPFGHGEILYVCNKGSDTFSPYSIGSTDGNLTSIGGAGPLVSGNGPIAASSNYSVGSAGFLYVANQIDENVSIYLVTDSSGGLWQVTNSPFPAGKSPSSLAAYGYPNGVLYVTNDSDNTVSAYSIQPSICGGTICLTLAASPGSPYSTGLLPSAAAIDPQGHFLYVANQADNTISAYSINGSTGALTPIVGSPFVAGSGPDVLAIAQRIASVTQ